MTTTHGPGSAPSDKSAAYTRRRPKSRGIAAGPTSLPTGSATAAQNPPEETTTEAAPRPGPFHPLWTYGVSLFNKFNNDTTMNLVAMVSFNVLTSIVPLILALITAIAVLPVVSNNVPEITAQINTILPSDLSSAANVGHVLTLLHGEGKVLTLVSIVGLLWGGMNLFSSIECAFAFIFKVKTRDLIPQKLMSLVMILLFVVLLPLSFVATIVVGAGTTALGRILPSSFSGPFTAGLGLATALAALFVLFFAIYTVVPNRPIPWSAAWRGAVFSTLAMAIVNTAFPIYTAHFVGTRDYSTAAIATAIVTITWFWFFSLVLLLGAQINALSMGIGPWKYDLTRTLMDYAESTGQGVMPPAAALRRRRHLFLIFSGIARDSHKVRPSGSGPEADRGKEARKPANPTGPSGRTLRDSRRAGREHR